MILHRAFVNETLRACGAVGAILLSIFVMVRLTGFLRQAGEGDIPHGSVLLLLALKVIAYLDLLAPLALYLGALLTVARWARDHELAAINAAGVGLHRLARPAMTLAVAVGALTALCALHLSPLSIEASRAIEHELRTRADAAAEAAAITPGVFSEIPTASGRGVYFVERRDDDGALRGVFLYRGGAPDRVVVADSARIGAGLFKESDANPNDDPFLILENGARYRGIAGAGEYSRVDFARYALQLRAPAHGTRTLPLKAMPTRALLRDGSASAIGELHWRIAKIVMLPVLMLFALAFASDVHRNRRFPGMLPALLIYFAYSNALGVGVALIRRGDADPHTTLWLVHLLFAALALHLLHRRSNNRRLLPARG